MGVADADEVTSPTFTLIHEYGDGRAFHLDLYRLDTAAQVEGLGFQELLDRNAVILILPAERVEIHIDTEQDSVRIIEVHGIAVGPVSPLSR